MNLNFFLSAPQRLPVRRSFSEGGCARILPLFAVFALFVVNLPAFATDTISLKITITGTPANNDTLVINGSTRTWKTSVTDATTQLAIGGAIGANTTNLYNHARQHGFTTIVPTLSGTNAVVFVAAPGQSLTYSQVGSWGTGVLTTNSAVRQYPLNLPSTAIPAVTTGTDPNRAQYVQWLIEALNNYYSTNKLTTPYAGVTDGAILSNAIVRASVLQWMTITNNYAGGTSSTNGFIFQASGDGGHTNAYMLVGDAFGWPTVHDMAGGSPLVYPEDVNGLITYQFTEATYPRLGNGAGPGVEQNNWNALNNFYSIVATNATIQAGLITAVLTNANLTNVYLGIMKNGVITNTTLTNVTLGGSAWLTNSMLTNSTVHATNGTLAGVTLTNAQVNATSGLLNSVNLTNAASFNSGATNLSLTNAQSYLNLNLVGDLATQRFDLTTLANGVNAGIDCATNSFVYIGSGPSAAFSIEGIINGRNGRHLEIWNATGQNMTIACEGGATGNDPTPANRIITCTGADIVTVGNGCVTLKYQSAIQRWVVTSFLP